MPSYNRVILAGYLTRDVELRHTQGGNDIGSFGLAVNRYSKENKSKADFFDIETWDKIALLCAEHLHKGSGVLIEGRLKQERWEQEGKSRSRIKIVASAIQFLPKGQGKDEGGQPNHDHEDENYGNGRAPF